MSSVEEFNDYEFLSSENLAMAEVNVENAQGEQFQEMVLEPPQDVLMQPEAQILQGQPMMVSHPRSSKYHNRSTSSCRQQDQEADLADNFSG